jgi:sugar phosphate isomerase/epimerase
MEETMDALKEAGFDFVELAKLADNDPAGFAQRRAELIRCLIAIRTGCLALSQCPRRSRRAGDGRADARKRESLVRLRGGDVRIDGRWRGGIAEESRLT